MLKVKKILIPVMAALLIFSVFVFALSIEAQANTSVITPYKPAEDMGVTAQYDNGNLNVSVTNIENYEYQYWIKTKVTTDYSENLANEQYIWELKQNFSDNSTAIISVGEQNLDPKGKYNIIVRIKDGNGNISNEVFKLLSADDVGKPIITNLIIDGITSYDNHFIINRQSTVTMNIQANIQSVQTYKIFMGSTEIHTGTENEFDVDMSLFEAGLNKLRVEAESQQGIDIKYFSVYVYDEYFADERPVITALTGETQWESNGITTFTMNVQYADGSAIDSEDADNYTYKLTSGNKNALILSKTVNNGVLNVVFEVDYNGQHGIYRTVGTVARATINGEDDKIIKYYDGYARDATLNQTAKDQHDNDLALTNYAISSQQPITITASGTIPDAVGDIEYAFYREDASGWVMIRGYSLNGEMTWTPTRPGDYKIQARIKDSEAGSYERTISRTYTITGVQLQGNLSFKIYDYQTNEEVVEIAAGRPYKIEADYTGTEHVLYMFTLRNENLGEVYLNNYNPSSSIMFIAPKVDTYNITARVISQASFGYKDLSFSSSVSSYLTGINLDGIIDEEEWNETFTYYAHEDGNTAKTTMYTHYGTRGVYIAYDVEDERTGTMNEGNPNLNQGSGVILFITDSAFNSETSHGIRIFMSGSHRSFRYFEGESRWFFPGTEYIDLSVAVVQNSNGYTMEVYIPYTSLNLTEKPDELYLFSGNFMQTASMDYAERYGKTTNLINARNNNLDYYWLTDDNGFIIQDLYADNIVFSEEDLTENNFSKDFEVFLDFDGMSYASNVTFDSAISSYITEIDYGIYNITIPENELQNVIGNFNIQKDGVVSNIAIDFLGITLDGIIDEEEWNETFTYYAYEDGNTAKTTMYTYYGANGLYVAYDVEDERTGTMNEGNPNLNQGSGVILFITDSAFNSETSHGIRIFMSGSHRSFRYFEGESRWYGPGGVPIEMTIAVAQNPDGYTMEIFIPYTSLNLTEKPDQLYMFSGNFMQTASMNYAERYGKTTNLFNARNNNLDYYWLTDDSGLLLQDLYFDNIVFTEADLVNGDYEKTFEVYSDSDKMNTVEDVIFDEDIASYITDTGEKSYKIVIPDNELSSLIGTYTIQKDGVSADLTIGSDIT